MVRGTGNNPEGTESACPCPGVPTTGAGWGERWDAAWETKRCFYHST